MTDIELQVHVWNAQGLVRRAYEEIYEALAYKSDNRTIGSHLACAHALLSSSSIGFHLNTITNELRKNTP